MTGRERTIAALTMKEFDRVPREMMFGYPDLLRDYPSDVTGVAYYYGKGKFQGSIGAKGNWIDEWGCVWTAAEDGVKGEVKEYLLDDWSKLGSFSPPWDVLREADLSMVDAQCKAEDRFTVVFWSVSPSPFQRMQFLRGTENLFIDLAEQNDEVFRLRDMVHEYFVEQEKMWCKTVIDAIHIEDDWGAQHALLISPALWRSFYKPLYKEYCEIAHAAGKFVIMHSDGYILDILEDLIEIGVDAINSQLFCMDIEELERRFGGRICFWGEIDRQYTLPFGTEADIRADVDRAASILLKNRFTGVVAQCPGGKDILHPAIRTVYDEWSHIGKGGIRR